MGFKAKENFMVWNKGNTGRSTGMWQFISSGCNKMCLLPCTITQSAYGTNNSQRSYF